MLKSYNLNHFAAAGKNNKKKHIPDNLISFYLGKYTKLSASKSMLIRELIHSQSTTPGLVFWLLQTHSKAISLLFLYYKYLLQLLSIPSCHKQKGCA